MIPLTEVQKDIERINQEIQHLYNQLQQLDATRENIVDEILRLLRYINIIEKGPSNDP